MCTPSGLPEATSDEPQSGRNGAERSCPTFVIKRWYFPRLIASVGQQRCYFPAQKISTFDTGLLYRSKVQDRAHKGTAKDMKLLAKKIKSRPLNITLTSFVYWILHSHSLFSGSTEKFGCLEKWRWSEIFEIYVDSLNIFSVNAVRLLSTNFQSFSQRFVPKHSKK